MIMEQRRLMVRLVVWVAAALTGSAVGRRGGGGVRWIGRTVAAAVAAVVAVVAGAEPLTCWTCSSNSHGSNCYNLDPENVTFAASATRNCSLEETYCTVKRTWYVVEEGGEEMDISFNRSCTSDCDPYCTVIGERTKIHSCTSCCRESYCNTGSSASSRHSSSTLLLLAAFLVAFTPTLTSALTPTVTSAPTPTLTPTPTLVNGLISQPVAKGRFGYEAFGSILFIRVLASSSNRNF